MSSKKFTKWVDKKNYATCFKIIQKYYIYADEGQRNIFLKKDLLPLLIKRLFLVFINLFRFNQNPYKKYLGSNNPSQFFKRIFGLYKLEIPGLLPENPAFTPLQFKEEASPVVSIVIAVHNHLNHTYNCLKSILTNTQNVSYEIIIVNDCSSDGTAAFLKEVSHINYLENAENLGFLRSCNKASAFAKGKYLCFLNNDTQVQPDWLYQMLAVFNNDKETGLVGSKLIYPYGLLQEAGGLIDYFGNPANYGKYQSPDLWTFNYLRQTDYCSGASILLAKADFELLSGFDERYAPAYYEDTDLCMAVRYQLNKKVYYQPLSHVVHFEGISSGKTVKRGSIKEYQQINAQKFKDKWTDVLSTFSPELSHEEIADKFNRSNTVLFIDVTLPTYDKDSGSRRIFELLKIFKSLDFNVIFLPHDGLNTEPYFSELTNLGIRVLYPGHFDKDIFQQLGEVLREINIAWISRPELNQFYASFIKTNPSITWAYDTVDLHFIREERRLKLQGSIAKAEIESIDRIMSEEIGLAKQADVTIAITETEAEILNDKGARNVKVIPNVHIPYTGSALQFKERSGVCFIGGYYHTPNVDAVIWLTKEIMPLVWRDHPHIKLTIIGSHPTPEILDLESPLVEVTGYVEDVTSYFTSSRIFVAPLRYGAGMKGKIGQSLEFSLPVITTDIGAEGMNLRHGHHVLIANTTEEIAHEIVNLYYNETLWKHLASHSFSAIEKYAPTNISREIIEIFKSI